MHSVSQDVFRCGNLTVRLLAKSGERGFHRTYRADGGDVFVTTDCSMYLVFTYAEYEGKKQVNKEEVYFSFPHMRGLVAALDKVYDALDTGNVFDEVEDEEHGYLCAVSQEYAKKAVRARGAGDKPVTFRYDTYEDTKKNEIHMGIAVNVLSKDSRVFVPEEAFKTMHYIIERIDLLTNCQGMVSSWLADQSSKSKSSRRAVTESE